MKNVILIHGCCDRDEYFSQEYPSSSNSHWFPWLQKQLLINDISTQTPEMPTPYDPNYDLWQKELGRFEINSETILVGHSCGGGFLLRYFSENKIRVNKLILVAPYLDLKREYPQKFLDFELDTDLLKRVDQMHILVSEDERVDGIKESVDKLLQIFPTATFHMFNDHGHFCQEEMGTTEFPELLKIVTD